MTHSSIFQAGLCSKIVGCFLLRDNLVQRKDSPFSHLKILLAMKRNTFVYFHIAKSTLGTNEVNCLWFPGRPAESPARCHSLACFVITLTCGVRLGWGPALCFNASGDLEATSWPLCLQVLGRALEDLERAVFGGRSDKAQPWNHAALV